MKVMLNYGLGKYEEGAEFPLGDLTVTLHNIPRLNAEMRYIAEMNGREIYRKNVSPIENIVEIPKEKLSTGIFSSCVVEYINGKPVQEFKIENLIISDIHETLFANPEIARLQKRIEILETYAETSTKEINRLKQLVNGLLNFAYDDFSKNVYLGGGTKDEFIKKYNLGEENETVD